MSATLLDSPFLNLTLLFALATAPSLAGEPAGAIMPARIYEVTTETGMPHLEENLRYTTTRERHCLAHQALATAFPILTHPALQGCRLDRESRQHDTVTYVLACEGGHGTTGNALWSLEEQQIRGTLNVKLGGKNMTFYQRITARPVVGHCGR